jgi:hypothetical protein
MSAAELLARVSHLQRDRELIRELRTGATTDQIRRADFLMTALEQNGMASVCQRWKAEVDSYVPVEGGTKFNPSDYTVAQIRKNTKGTDPGAKEFVLKNHYSGSFPQWTCGAGLFHGTTLVGAAAYGNGPPQAAGKPSLYAGLGHRDIAELKRFVLLPDVPGRAETWFLARANQIARDHYEGRGDTLKLLLSYADPVPRKSTAGKLTMPGHIGNIYQASNALYIRPAEGKTLFLTPEGHAPDPRMLSKIESLDRSSPQHGAVQAQRRLISEYAPGFRERLRGERHKSWMRQVLASKHFRALQHPGNLVYAWAFGSKREKSHIVEQLPYEHQLPWDDVIRFLIRGDVTYPKKQRQMYISVANWYDRAWCRGQVAEATLYAHGLMLVWKQMTPAQKGGLRPPPQLRHATCAVPRKDWAPRRGGGNRQGFSLDQILAHSICELDG